MFVFFETKPCLQELLFAVSSGLVNYLGTGIMFAGIYICDLKMVRSFDKYIANISQTLMNLQ